MKKLALAAATLALPFLWVGYGHAQQSSQDMAGGGSTMKLDAATQGGQTVQVGDATIFYKVTGDGQPLLLIHGYPLSGDLFVRQHQALSEHFKVITLDLPGFGESKSPATRETIAAYADDVLALMDELKIDSAIIGGHSMGGIITLEMYTQASGRFDGMILIDTVAADASPIGANLWKGFAEQARKKGVGTLPAALIPEMLTGDARLNNPDLVKYLQNIVKQASVDGAVAGGVALALRPSYTDMLSSIQVPTLILFGQEDTVTPVALGKKMDQTIPSSRLVIIKGGSHAAILEEGNAANQAIARWASESIQGVNLSGSEIAALGGGGQQQGGQSQGGGQQAGTQGELAAMELSGRSIPHPAHIHTGTCQKVGKVVAPLNTVDVPQEGNAVGKTGRSRVATSFTQVDQGLNAFVESPHVINVHLSSKRMGTYIACGPIGGVPRADGGIPIELHEESNSGFAGIAYLNPQKTGSATEVSIFLDEPRGK